ncbi:hypothetical protein TYRP_012328 [Tyrophagus putrescentiae]|nr:hypothetical protein TYRP_012328 [Tyrophagus putrescentiae]
MKKSKVNNNRSHWKTFISLHRKLTFLCQATEAYSRRCTPFLCVVFPFYITVQCYLLYIAVFVDTPPEQVAIFYVSIVGCNILVRDSALRWQRSAFVSSFRYLSRTPQEAKLWSSFRECRSSLQTCAGIVKNNGTFERLTREYICECHLRLKQSEPNVNLLQLKRQLVKMDLFQGNKRLSRYTFKMFAYFRITSKTYYMCYMLYIVVFIDLPTTQMALFYVAIAYIRIQPETLLR